MLRCSPTRLFLVAALGLVCVAPMAARADEHPSPGAVLTLMRRVADWQLAAPLKPHITVDAWESGVFYTGVMALGDLAPEPTYHDAMAALGARQQWKLKAGPYNPDNYVIGQTYLELYLQEHQSAMIAPLRAQFDGILAHPADDDLDLRKPGGGKNNWSWCDTLFMGPGTWARMTAATGDRKYLAFADRNWWVTSDYLYDKDKHLFYRDSRFFDLRGPGGEKIFWARGNGWVVAGLVRVLQFMPADSPDRPRFLQQLRELANRVADCQQADGSWHPSLLDPASPDEPEASGTGLFTYGLAWGVNHGLLDRAKFEPVIWKAWASLASFVQPDGRLAHTQPGGDRPAQFSPDNNDSFGAGAFLLAGSEVYRLSTPDHPSAQR